MHETTSFVESLGVILFSCVLKLDADAPVSTRGLPPHRPDHPPSDKLSDGSIGALHRRRAADAGRSTGSPAVLGTGARNGGEPWRRKHPLNQQLLRHVVVAGCSFPLKIRLYFGPEDVAPNDQHDINDGPFDDDGNGK